MGVFDRFKARSNVPKGYSEVKVTFTEEEIGAMNTHLDEYAAIVDADAPDGMMMYVHPKVKEAMKATALTEYAKDLVGQRMDDCASAAEMKRVLDKAIKAQMKAYAIHNLPVYLYLIGMMFEIMSEADNANDFFRHFLRAQEEFKPDKIDTIFLNQAGFDTSKLVIMAKQKVGIAQ
jgi:hypothetical protein